MPTSSQSRILSVVDYQLHQKQQNHREETHLDLPDGPTLKPIVRISINRTSVSPPKRRPVREERRLSFEQRIAGKGLSPSPPPNITARRRSSGKLSDGKLKNCQGRIFFRFVIELSKKLTVKC